MGTPRERILIVENNLDVSNLIARQTLQPLGYKIEVVKTAANAIQEAVRFSPDVIMTNLLLPGLSGKDLLVALNSQGLEIPVIVISETGMESDVIQAFRLGAADYLRWPAREAEIVSVVERALQQVRAYRERETLSRQLNQTNQELQRRVRELTTIFAIGKAVTSLTDQQALFDKIVEGSIYISEADSGWLLLREDNKRLYILKAQRNLPESVAEKLNQPWDDGVSSLVGLSGEPLSIHGEPLKRFKVSRLGQSVLVTPIKVRSEVIGLLVVVRKNPRPFGPDVQALLEAVADYASISLVNARLFRVLEDRARSMQQAAEIAQENERNKDEVLKSVKIELSSLLAGANETVTSLLIGENTRLNATQKNLLRTAQEKLQHSNQVLETLTVPGLKV
jgi:two-component system NtrC family sensor kinase